MKRRLCGMLLLAAAALLWSCAGDGSDSGGESPSDDDGSPASDDDGAADDDANPDDDTFSDEVKSIGGSPSIGVHAQGAVHIVFVERTTIDYTTNGVMELNNAGDAWEVEGVGYGGEDWDPTGGFYNALALDGQGLAHVSYNAEYYSCDAIAYARDREGHFAGECLGVGEFNQVSKIAVDSGGFAHITYGILVEEQSPYRADNPLRYSTNRSGEWTTQTLIDTEVGGATIAIGPDDRVHLLYLREFDTLELLVGDGETWETPQVVTEGGVWPQDFALAVDPAGGVHVVYVHEGRGLTYSSNRSGGWVETVIDAAAADGQPVLALDESDVAHTAYVRVGDRGDPAVFYVELPIDDPAAASPAKAVAACDWNGSKLCGSLAVEPSGAAHVAVVSGEALHYYSNRSGEWKTEYVYYPDKKR